MLVSNEKQFIRAQIREIHIYLAKHGGRNPERATLEWIDRYAAEFQKHWEESHRRNN